MQIAKKTENGGQKWKYKINDNIYGTKSENNS